MWEKVIKQIKGKIKTMVFYALAYVMFKIGLNKNRFVFVKGNLPKKHINRPIILFLPDEAWNTIEQNLPGLVYLKKHFDVFLIVALIDQKVCARAEEEPCLMDIVEETADVVMSYKPEPSNGIFSQFFSYRWQSLQVLLHRIFNSMKINILVRVWSYNEYYDYFYKKHPETKHVGVGHTTCYATYDGADYYDEGVFFKVDKLLFPDKYTYRGNSDHILKHSVVIGAQIYDSWWKDILKRKYTKDIEGLLGIGGKAILVLIPNLSDTRLFPKVEKKIFEEFLIKYSSSNIILVKFHPRDSKKNIDAFLSGLGDELNSLNVRICKIPTVVISSEVDCAIAFGVTNALIDVIANGIPAIEVNDGKKYLAPDEVCSERYLIENGVYGTFYRKNNLALYAKTYNELCDLLDKILYKHGMDNCIENYSDYFMSDNCASERMAKEIMSIVDK